MPRNTRELPQLATHSTKREQFRQDALGAWSHYQTTGRHLTAEEADTWLAELEADKNAAPPKCHH